MSYSTRTYCLQKNITVTLPESLNSSVSVSGGDKFTYYICNNLEVATELETFFNTNNVKFNKSSYSLFVRYLNPSHKSTTDIHKELLSFVNNLLPNVNVTYSRIDETANTGKLCVDLYDNYLKLKSLNENSEFRFFAFNPKRMNTRSNSQTKNTYSRNSNRGSYSRGQSNRGQSNRGTYTRGQQTRGTYTRVNNN